MGADLVITDVTLRPDTPTDYCADANIVGCYRFNEDAGYIVDTSGNDYHSKTAGSGTYQACKEVNCWDRNGTTEHNEMIDHGLLSSAISIVAWTRHDTADFDLIVSRSTSDDKGNYELRLRTPSSSNYEFVFRNSADTLHPSMYADSTVISANAWTHVGLTHTWGTTNDSDIYVNGIAVSTSDAASLDNAVITSGTQVFNIGCREDGCGTTGFDGEIDELAIFSRILTAAEILDIYTNGLK